MITHITPHLAQAKEKEPYEFTSFITDMPAVASLAVLAPETGVLSAVAKLISDEEQLPYAMSALQHLSRGLILAKWSLGQSDEIYPAIVKMLQKGDESIKNTILSHLEFLIYSSTVTKMKFIKSGGIKPLLEAVDLEDERVSRKAMATLIYLVTDYPEGAKAVIDAGAVEILKTKDDSDDIFKHKTSALELLETLKDAPEVDRIQLTVEAYTALGKQLSEPGMMERLVENLKSSTDEKHLTIAGGILPVFADMLRSSSNPFPVLEALYAIYVADGVVMSGANIAASVGVQAGLPDALKPLVQSEDEKTKEYAIRVSEAVMMKRNDELRKDEAEDEQQDEQEENAEAGAEDEADNKSEKEDEDS
ncbi:hypothetical protein FRC12_013236 [Ceratobasidium sp. 428]|nr:hypothetical protein FRC12_013236 [Ceratobasidium sp. 428]